MRKCVSHFLKGMGIGVAVGSALGMMGACCVRKNKKGIKHNAGRALHCVGDLLESVTDMF